MKLIDFVIGEVFRCSERLWRCTDIGTRVVLAIRIDQVEVGGIADGVPKIFRTLAYNEAEAEGWFKGPPYAVAESVFDENNMSACFRVSSPTMARIGEPLTWVNALPLIRALRDIAQSSTDPEAVDVAASALREVFPDANDLSILFL